LKVARKKFFLFQVAANFFVYTVRRIKSVNTSDGNIFFKKYW